MTETINGLHSCKPGNDPVVGQIKLFVIENRKGKSGKPYIKIRSANAENGGTPHRILNAEKTDFVDQHGNISFNIEVEASSSQPDPVGGMFKSSVKNSAFQQTKAAMQQGEYPPDERYDTPEQAVNAPQSLVRAQQGEDGVMATRKHLMQTSNLMVLCIKAADYVALQLPEVAHTSEQFAGILGQLFKEAYSRRTTDGVNWWSYVDRMPCTPIAKPPKEEEKEYPF